MIKVYCRQHDTVHQMGEKQFMILFHTYQHYVAHLAYTNPLPVVEGVSDPDTILKVSCPIDEYVKLDRNDARKYAELMHTLRNRFMARARARSNRNAKS